MPNGVWAISDGLTRAVISSLHVPMGGTAVKYTQFHLLLAIVSSLGMVSTVSLASDLPLQITSDTTLTSASSPYYLVGNTIVAAGAVVRVEPGVEVISNGSYGLYVHGTLLMTGSDEAPIVFRPADNDSVGTWQGLILYPTAQAELQACTIRGAKVNAMMAGGVLRMAGCRVERAETDGMYVYGNSYVHLSNCLFADNKRHGLYIETTTPVGSVWRCHFHGNGEYPVFAKATCAEMLRRGNRYTENGLQRIGVSCSAANDIADVDLWCDQDDLPYDLTAGTGNKLLEISGVLQIEAGITIIGTAIEVTGSLYAEGTDVQPITFVGPTASPGSWTGITLRIGAQAELYHTTVRDAETALTADGARMVLADCAIVGNRYDGVRCCGGTLLDVADCDFDDNGRDGLRLQGLDHTSKAVRNCSFAANQRYPVYAHADDIRLLGVGNQYHANSRQRIGVACHLDPDLPSGYHEWITQAVPFDLKGSGDAGILHVGSQASLHIGSGATVLGGGIHVRGQFDVSGSEAQRSYFGAATEPPKPGDWEGLFFDTGATGSICGADIRHANHGVEVHSASPRFKECYITGCKYDGMRFLGTSESAVTGTWTVENGRYGVYIGDTAGPNFGNTENANSADDGLNHIHDNGSYQVYNLSPHDIYMHNNWWGTTALADIRAATYDYHDNPELGELLIGQIRGSGPGEAGVEARGAGPALAITAASVQMLPGGMVQLTYRVSSDCDVLLRIANIAGRPVVELKQEATSQRLMTLVWDGRSAYGAATPSGRYLCLLRALGADGQCSQVIVPLER